MKKYLYIISLIICTILSNQALGVTLAEDIDNYTDEIPWNRSDENLGEALFRTGKKIYEMYKYFDEKYPEEKLQEDFSEEVAKQYPSLNHKEVRKREQNIRFVLGLYRNGKKIYEKIKSQFLVPEDPPLIFADEEYDDGTYSEYIKSDNPLIITDFKKVISYGKNPQDIKAMSAKRETDYKIYKSDDPFVKIYKTLAKLEFSKLLDYGKTLPSPFTGTLGIGELYIDRDTSARIISSYSGLEKNNIIKGIINIHLANKGFMLLNPTKKYTAPKIDFQQSENLRNYQLSWLPPQRIYIHKQNDDFVGYYNFLSIPIVFEVEDITKPLIIQANIEAYVCNEKLCQKHILSPKLQLLPEDYAQQTDYYTYINSVHNHIPQKENKKIKFISATEERNEFNEPTLKIKYKTNINPADFNIYLTNNYNIIFGYPKMSVRDNIITYNISVNTPNTQLIGKEISIIAGNLSQSIVNNVKIKAPSILDTDNRKITLGIVILAIFGGFLLNLMPCVFPVLSLKLISLLQFGAQQETKLRRSFIYTLLGIYSSFAVITIILLSLKFLGYSLGWGIQFQNIWFLTTMLLLVSLFFAQSVDLIRIGIPQKLTQIYKIESENLLSFLTGMLLVLLSTPCTAPYLGTAVGFALTGNYIDICIIIPSIALGLSLPYLLFAIYPQLTVLLPPPGKWMKYISQLMSFMLFLTIIWLLSIIAAQTSLRTAIHLGICLFLLFTILWIYNIFIESTYQETISQNVRNKLQKIYIIATIILLLPIFFYYFYDSYTSFEKTQQEAIHNRKLVIDDTEILQKIKDGKNVLVNIRADWCLTCKFNDIILLDDKLKDKYNLEIIEIDWTNYNQEILNYMEQFGRKGLPFYILFSPKIPNGIVLPEILTEINFIDLLNQL